MKTNKISIISAIFLLGIIAFSCTSDDTQQTKTIEFDRKGILTNMSENYIIPAIYDLVDKLHDLATAVDNFQDIANVENLKLIRVEWEKSYIAWQYVGFIEVGEAEKIHYKNYMNTYPCNIKKIHTNIINSYDLDLSFTYNEQGFPALDYMINGLADTDVDILAKYLDPSYKKYLKDITYRMLNLSKNILKDWMDSYKKKFIENVENTALGSLNLVINDYIKYYEMDIRDGKIAIPSGVFTDNISPEKLEGYYYHTKNNISKLLFQEALKAMDLFYKGLYFLDNEKRGKSIYDFVESTQKKRNGELLSSSITNTFSKILNESKNIGDDFRKSVISENSKFKEYYKTLQEATVLMKVDMLQALNIRVDYIDADGD